MPSEHNGIRNCHKGVAIDLNIKFILTEWLINWLIDGERTIQIAEAKKLNKFWVNLLCDITNAKTGFWKFVENSSFCQPLPSYDCIDESIDSFNRFISNNLYFNKLNTSYTELTWRAKMVEQLFLANFNSSSNQIMSYFQTSVSGA